MPTDPERSAAAASPMSCAALDIDGVLADTRHRLHLLQRSPKQWEAFFAAASEDPLLPEGSAVAHRLAEDHEVVYLTGRPERCRTDTEQWLARHGLPPGRLLMRRAGDRRPAPQTKTELMRRLARECAVEVLVDDDAAVAEAVRRAGFGVLLADWMPSDAAEQLTLAQVQQEQGRT